MSVVERAGRRGVELRVLQPEQQKPGSEGFEPESKLSFDLDYVRLSQMGLYHPAAKTSQLARELRAIKRRLFRRLGFLQRDAGGHSARPNGKTRNMVMVTSSKASEGKTFSALNLALNLALEDGVETLLVDADTPRPKIRDALNLPAGRGLTDKIADPDIALPDLCWRARQAPLSILGEGFVAPDKAAGLFASEAGRALWRTLQAQSADRIVIIDAPPALAATEAVVLARYVDEVVFVVEANATPQTAAAAALDELLDVNGNISLILNRCLIGAGGSHYSSYDYYGRESSPRAGMRVGYKQGDASNGAHETKTTL